MKKSISAVLGFLLFLSFAATSCVTELPAFDTTLPVSETALLFIPKHISIISMDDKSVRWENGQVRIPAGEHTFTLISEEDVMVPDALRYQMTGSNYRFVKQRVGPDTESYAFTAGERYILSSQMYHRRTFESQYVQYTIKPYIDSYPKDSIGMGMEVGAGDTWNGKGRGHMDATLSVKVPSLPIFWDLKLYGSDLTLDPITTNIMISGDYLFYKRFFPHDDWFWYIGAGVGLGAAFGENKTGIMVLGRTPIGISWLLDFSDTGGSGLEMYLQGVPSLGMTIPDFVFPYGSWSIDFGCRFWF